MNAEIELLADRLLAAWFTHSPLEAALSGLPDVGEGLGDLSCSAQSQSAGIFASIASQAEDLLARVAGEEMEPDGSDLVTLDLVRFTAGAYARYLQFPGLEFTITDLYDAPLSGLVAVLPMLSLDTAERRASYLERLRSFPTFLEQAVERHRIGIAAGRNPTARGVRAALAQIDEVLADPDLAGIRRRDAADADDDFATKQEQVVVDSVLVSISRYAQFLRDEALPAGRSDEHPGLCWLPEGDDMYAECIEFFTWSDRSAEDLHAQGLSIVEHLNEEFVEIGSRLWGARDVTEVHHRLKTDVALRFESSEEILATAVEAVRRAEQAAPEWFGLIPHVACAVEPIPEALVDGAPVAYYFAGALDGSRAGTYYVNTTKPGERDRHVAEAVAFHEAVPGHHFQLTIAQELLDAHLVRRVMGDGTTAEGWGLYAERLADEMGLYSDDVSRLGMLSTDAMRAARLVVDTGLHALGWSRQATIDWMAAHVPMSLVEVESEVDRYVAAPGQALSYMVGRLEIERLRGEASEELGEAFDVRAFHDLLLTVGPVPLPALTIAVHRWMDAKAS
jgi:uncharacterized protein (DUF885 family)